MLRLLLCCLGGYFVVGGFVESLLLDGQVIETQIYIVLYTVGALLFLTGVFLPQMWKMVKKSVIARIIGSLFCVMILFLFALAGLVAIWPSFATKADGSEPVMLVLGAPVINDEPSIILQSREKAASEWARENPNVEVIIAGGKGGTKTEAETIANWMENDGIDPSRIQIEKNSTTTEENLRNTKELMAGSYDVSEEPVAILTNRFHIYRLHLFLKQQGYGNVHFIVVPTPHSVGLLWYVREAVLLLVLMIYCSFVVGPHS